MATVSNTLARPQEKKQSPAAVFKTFIKSDLVQENLMTTLGDITRTKNFTASIISNVNLDSNLATCKRESIVTAALLGETLKLSPAIQLGQFYMVPFKQKAKKDDQGRITEPACTVAVFVLGYKGMIQLAIRSGQYKKMVVTSVKEGELVSWNPMTEEIEFDPLLDDDERATKKTIGYYAYFELVNGFRKAMYWSQEKMVNHADKYSQAFSKNGGNFGAYGQYHRVSYADYAAGNYPKGDDWMYSSFWYKDFEGMAYKTMLRQLISRWGVMSIDMQKAYTDDNTWRDDLSEDAQPHYAEEAEVEAVEVVVTQPEDQEEPDRPEPPEPPEPQYSRSLL